MQLYLKKDFKKIALRNNCILVLLSVLFSVMTLVRVKAELHYHFFIIF